MNQKLTQRDISVIKDVCNYRYLSTSQLKRLHFPSDDVTWRRLKILSDRKLIKSFTAPSIPEFIYHLDKKGAELIACELEIEVEEVWPRRTNHPKDYFFMRHFLAINDFWILLKQTCPKHDIELFKFVPEYHGEKTKEGYVKRAIRLDFLFKGHTPDAIFSLRKNGKAALFFLEIDRGNEVVSDPERGLLKAIIFYLNYWTSEKWQQHTPFFGGEFKTFRTLIITTSKERIKHIREVTTNYPFHDSHAKRFVWTTPDSQVTEDWLFESIWQSLDITDNNLYRIG
jgi:protein involved in plasmid replication-relaxation